jgi:pyruvate dehydrogenase E1 component
LNGEGLQHEDGHSHVLASTIPNLISYDPAFGYEVAIIVREGLRRMFEEQEDVFYYLTLYNENYLMPGMEGVCKSSGLSESDIETGVLQGAYRFSHQETNSDAPWVNILASGSIFQQALDAQILLTGMGFNVALYSVTSFIELERQAQSCARYNRLHPLDEQRTSHVEILFAKAPGVFVAVTDYMKSLAAGIAPWLPGKLEVLGTDGYGLSESRPALRQHFEVDGQHVCAAALTGLYRNEMIDGQVLNKHLQSLQINADRPDPRDR